jgi:hypothetical protein
MQINLSKLKATQLTYLTPKEVCELYPFKVQTLAVDRCHNKGIPFIKLPNRGGKVLYIKEVIDDWLLERLNLADAILITDEGV